MAFNPPLAQGRRLVCFAHVAAEVGSCCAFEADVDSWPECTVDGRPGGTACPSLGTRGSARFSARARFRSAAGGARRGAGARVRCGRFCSWRALGLMLFFPLAFASDQIWKLASDLPGWSQ